MKRTGNQDGREGGASPGDAAPAPAAGLDDEEATRQARRRLLKMAVYSAPLVIGTFLSRDAEAGSCGPPNGCYPYPCDPRGCDPMQ